MKEIIVNQTSFGSEPFLTISSDDSILLERLTESDLMFVINISGSGEQRLTLKHVETVGNTIKMKIEL